MVGGWSGWVGLGIDICSTAVDAESVDLVRVCVAGGVGDVVAAPIDCVGGLLVEGDDDPGG